MVEQICNKVNYNDVEFYHNQGLMPDRAYYQLNDKSIMDNYIEQKEKIMQRFAERQNDSQDVYIISEVQIIR